MLAGVYSASLKGIEAVIINIEVDLARGLPAFNIVGLPNKAVRESRSRVRAAIKNSGYEFPVKKITINMAPANIRKIGPHYDLAIAAGILAATGKIDSTKTDSYLIAGELLLNGKIRGVKGILPMALKLKERDFSGLVLPEKNCDEARLVEGINIVPVKSVTEMVDFFSGENHKIFSGQCRPRQKDIPAKYNIDFSDIRGQQAAKRSLEIAAAGHHNTLMIGPPGSGKTMLAKRLRTILPPLTEEEALELTKIYSIMGAGKYGDHLLNQRPFRAPHQNITTAGLIGGGKIPEPGEVTMAHHGTLFLDELPEYRRKVLEALRQPLEEDSVTIVRSAMTVRFPGKIMLITAMNPCPCGYYGDDNHSCSCSISRINNYRAKISGPLLDRIDIHIEVPALSADEITGNSTGEKSKTIKHRVVRAHNIQLKRYSSEDFNHNSRLRGQKIKKYCTLNKNCRSFLKRAIKKLGLSARAHDGIMRISRTISDLEGETRIKKTHLAEAIQCRNLVRKIT